MRGKNPDLHGAAPDSSPVALLIIDMLSDFEFEGAAAIFPSALRAARAVAKLKARTTAAGIPTVYVNDNVGRWQSSAQRVIDQNARRERRGYPIDQLLRPTHDDYFILKPKHSGFFATPLELVLAHLGAHALILTGLTVSQCILFTAIDAYVRDFSLYVPRDCIAAATRQDVLTALPILESSVRADTRPSPNLRIPALLRRRGQPAA